MRVSLATRTLRLRRPLETAFGTLTEREIVEIELAGPDGPSGRGEAAPLEPYDGVSVETVREALEAYARVLGQAGELTGSEILDRCRAIADVPHALAAVDIALWDLAGKREGRPIAEMLTDTPAHAVAVNATIGATDRAGAATAALEAARQGFECVKVKVGVGDDAGRVAAVRAAMGPRVALRLDANGAWTVEEAIVALEALAPAGVELVEEPVHGIHDLREVRRLVPLRVAMDETTAEPGALASGATDAVCLKLSRCGGISGLVAAAELVRATGAEPYVASAFDGPVGIAAAVHAAAALWPLPPCGLATLALFEPADVPDAAPLAVRDGAIGVPEGPGLGL